MQALKVINQQKQEETKEVEEVPETNEDVPYLYIQDGDLYCSNCDCIGYYLSYKECCICGAKWPEGKEPSTEELEKLDFIRPPPKPAPLVRQLSVPHMPDIPEFRDYNAHLDRILESQNIQSQENHIIMRQNNFYK
jgi:hypothetical protein